jgi:hypothetical protein
MELLHAETTGPLIKLFFDVCQKLGYGLLERLYSNAMVVAGKRIGLQIIQNMPI